MFLKTKKFQLAIENKMKKLLILTVIAFDFFAVKAQFIDSTLYIVDFENTKIIHSEFMTASLGYYSSKHEIDTNEIKINKTQLYVEIISEDNYSFLNIINATKNKFIIEGQDGSIPFIREALDSAGIWKPIEYWVHPTCGNSYSSEILNSGYYLKIQFYNYSGKYKTKLRYKIKINGEIIYTDAFDGLINYSQFNVSKKRRQNPNSNFLN